MSVKVTFDIGHESTLRNKPTPDGFTHDWELYVRGCDSNDISQFVDRVVFNLHESFPKPKRVVKEPPFILKESGYAGFVLSIDIHFRNRDEPKKATFKYDLVLQITVPFQNNQKEKFVFPNPSDEFRKKLLKGGGVIIHHNVNNLDEKSRDSNDERAQLLNKPKLGGSDHSKKHKRPDDNTFSNLFGPPIPKVIAKVSPDSRSKSSSSNSKFHQNLPNVQKLGSDKKSQHTDKKAMAKDKIKQKHSSPHKESKKSDEKLVRDEKKLSHSKERDQSRDKSKKNLSPKHSQSSTQKTEMKHPAINSSSKKSKKEKKEKNHDKEKEREKKDDKSHKQKMLSSKEIFKEKQKPNEKILSVQNDLPFDSSKQVQTPEVKKTEKHKHKKKDKNKKDESKDKEKKRERSERSSSKSSAIYDETADSRSSKSKETKQQQTPLDALMGEISERESSDSETENHNQKQEKDTLNNYQPDLLKSQTHTHSKSEKPSKRSSKEKARSIEKEEKKRKRKNKDEIEQNDKTSSSMDPPKKIYKKEENYKHLLDTNSSTSLDNLKVSPIPDIIEKDLTIDYMSDLKDLQHKIMTLQSNSELQQVVEIIAATGRFEVTSKTFDFDLCVLDKDTVQKLQTFFQPS